MFAHYLQKRLAKAAKGGACEGIEVLPPGLVADLEDQEDLDSLRGRLQELERRSPTTAGGPAWIAKASNANRGESMLICQTADDVVAALGDAALGAGVVEWVVQRYVSPPLLLRGRKFHVRAHVLVSGCPSCGTTRAWLHGEHHVALVATAPYVDDCGDRSAHLTNHCLQAELPDYDEAAQILALEELDGLLGRPGVAAHAAERMTAALAEALAAVASAPAGFAPLPQCFELFGADFALEDRGPDRPPGVWLLEVNAGPDMAVFGQRLRWRCVALLRDVLRAAVEPHLGGAAAHSFVDPAACACAAAAERAGFRPCLWSAAPKAPSAAAELDAAKRRLGIAARWAKALHEGSGVAVRGPQGAALP